ncbi:MAG: cupin domain-containing protein [Gammaproteobacteria bacterium]|nr:cupin domain-containing protein [Gammaproteobacteria bacterium]
MMHYLKIVFIAAMLWAPTLHAEPLLKTKTSWDGGEIYYPKGEPEITSIKLKLAEGMTTKFHCHPVPTLGYILKGRVEVETKDGKKVLLKEGESAVEVMRTLHRGKAINGPVEILVFYAGSTSVPNTVFAGDDPKNLHCDG